mgnify:CR=1 FL=1
MQIKQQSLSILVMLAALPIAAPAGPVRLWETNQVIPTYLAAPPSPIPRFYSGRTYQGAKATFYPYPVQDQLTDIKTNKTYKLLYLENDFIQISVLPEIGGRIFSAVDKSNGYDFFYRQHVIKPALIGMLGAWISGGVEWNFPHHHRASSFMPVEYTSVTNADGSATIWVGETELRHRMRWLVGMTLYPDRSYLELNCKVFNRTPFAHPMLFWINTAVHASTNYQVIFPPSTEWAAQHAKPEFASWPIARQVYGGVDYTRGVDISWWKNHPSPVSFFAWNYEDDWFGGYDHGKQAGVLHVADHNVAPGKKFFEWGNGPEGEMWSKVLTDDDGPYLELMAGAWSDNQPDYSWIQPGETREWQHWWYPIRDMGGVKAANKDIAVNLEITNGLAKVSVNVTRNINDAEIALMWQQTDIWQMTTNLGPLHPFSAKIQLKDESIPPNEVGLSVRQRGPQYPEPPPTNKHFLYAYWPKPAKNTPMPKPVERPKNPKDYASTDELYFTGQRIEQLCSPSFEAAPYYQEILHRDPGDYRANNAMGILLCKQWRWAEAEKHLRAAIARATANHIRPKDGEAFYYLGVALREQAAILDRASWSNYVASRERLDEAAAFFSRASWSAGWRAAACYQLGEIASAGKDFKAADFHLEQALAGNSRNPQALNLRGAILLQLGRADEARRYYTQAALIDPLDWQCRLEMDWAKSKSPEARKMLSQMSYGNLMELYIASRRAGFEQEANLIAENCEWLPWLDIIRPQWPFLKASSGAAASLVNFPFQHEMVRLLETAGERNSASPAPWYHLGCLLYDHQPAQAIVAWEESRTRDDKFALVHRNLGLAYAQHQKDIPKAIASLEKAVDLDPKEPRFLYELDVQHEAGGAAVKRRLAWLTKTPGVAAWRDDSLTRLILVYMADGQLDQALQILTTHRFHNWEGSSEIRNVYVDARLLRGQQHLRAKRAAEALKDFQATLEFPANLEVGRPKRDSRTAPIHYHIGLAQEALGQAEPAKANFTKAAEAPHAGSGEPAYYRAAALQKLGRTDDAKPIFESLVKQGRELQTSEPADYFAKFGEKRAERVRQADAHYLAGLGLQGLGKKSEAEAEFKKALELHPAHLGALASQLPSTK